MDPLLRQFRYLSELQARYVRVELHLLFLFIYLLCGVTPPGLSFKTHPSVIEPSNALIQQWDHIVSSSRIALHQTLIQHYLQLHTAYSLHLDKMLFLFKQHSSTHRIESLLNLLTFQRNVTSRTLLATKLKKLFHHVPAPRILGTFSTILSSLKPTQFSSSTHQHSGPRIERHHQDRLLPDHTNTGHKDPQPITSTKRKHRRFIRHDIYKQRLDQTDINRPVINISSYNLNKHEENILSKNLSFCPTPTKVNFIEVSADLFRFGRRLRLAEYFHKENDEDNTDNPNIPPFLQKPSTFTPNPGRDPSLDLYINAVSKQVMNMDTRKIHPNINKQEQHAILSLQSNKDITIKPADKGGAVVVMNTSDYMAECYKHLNNTQHYKQIDKDQSETHNKMIKSVLQQAVKDGEIDPDTCQSLIVPKPTPGRFYTVPKIHKQGNPGRPIVSGNGCATEKISQFVDYHTKDAPRSLPSFVQDDMDFLRHVEEINNSEPLPTDTLLCTLDVGALYTNIPHQEGITACRETLDLDTHTNTNSTANPPSTTFICKLIQLILTLNIFTFDDKFWLQTHGTAMGTCMAPSYANIFMGAIENKLINMSERKPLIWLRYIDDIFMIWKHGRETLNKFLETANSFHPTIKFTSHISTSQVPFLDVMVSLKNGRLITDLYSKPSDTFNYLHWSSCHPNHTKKAFPTV